MLAADGKSLYQCMHGHLRLQRLTLKKKVEVAENKIFRQNTNANLQITVFKIKKLLH